MSGGLMSGERMSGGRMSGGRLSGGLMSGGLMSAHPFPRMMGVANWYECNIWLRAWDTLAMMKLWRREVVSSIPDRGTIVG